MFVRIERSFFFDVFFSPAVAVSTVHVFVEFLEDFSEAIEVNFLVAR